MNQHPESDDRSNDADWAPCQGEICQLGRRLSSARTQRRTVVSGAALLLAGVGLFAVSRAWNSPELVPAVLACGDVKAYRTDFAAGRLSDQLERSIERHLAGCPACRRYYAQLRAERGAAADRISLQAVL